MPDPHKLIATVTQTEKIHSDGSGVVRGSVNIVFVRQPEHRELDRGQIEAAALKDGISLSISSQSRTEDVYVIDAKNYTGRAQLSIKGGIFSPRVEKLMVGRRDCTKLVEGVHKHVDRVSELLARDGIGQDVPVRGMLCFVEGDWPVLGGSFTIGGLDVLWPKKARKIITAPGALSDDRLRVLHRHLAAEFPPA